MAIARAAQAPAAGRRIAAGRRPAWIRDPATLLLAAAVLASAAALLTFTGPITFLLDEWTILLYRRGFDAHVLLDPHNEHIVLGPVLVYKGLLEVFGMDSPRPFQVVSTGVFLTSCVLLFAWLRGRAGDWLALGGAILILFLGAAWEDLLWSFQMGFFGSVAAGLGMLLALRRETAAADRLACLLLAVAMSFSSLGIPFAVGAAVAVATGPDWRRRAYVVVVPVALFAVWWLGWGHTADNHASLHNLAAAPLYVFDAIASAISSLLGLATPRDESGVGSLDWGRPLAAFALVLAAVRIHRLGSVPRWLWVVGAIALSYWLLSAINLSPARDATASRYQYPGAIFVLLVAAELLRGVRPRAPALVAGAAVLAFAVLSNLSFLDQSAESHERTSDLIKADLGAVEIARDTVDPGFVLTNDIAGNPYVHVPAGLYLSAVDAFGSPADDEQEIATAPEPAREAADRVLAAALGLQVERVGVPRVAGPGCQRIDPASGPQAVALAPSGVDVQGSPSARVSMRLRRFSTASYPVEAGRVIGDERAAILIPTDRSTVPWQLELSGRGEVLVCSPVEAMPVPG